jgi:anti-sigma B factor antagonist
MPAEPTLEQAPPFELLTVSVDGDLVVAVRGEIDLATAPQLWEHLVEAIPSVKHRLVLDLHDTAFMDSAALSVFVRAFKRLRHQGADLVVRSPRPNARQVLQISGLDRILTVEGRSEAPPAAPT